jgi:amidase
VAANLAAASIGSETSGSLIQPARVNSLVSLRPSLGLISRDYVVPLAPDLDTTGPMARSVTDTAVLLNVLAGVDPQDPKTQDAAALEGVDFTQFLSLDAARKLRVGVIRPTHAAAALLQSKRQLLEQATGRQLSGEEQAALLAQELLPDLGGDPHVAIAALKALGINFVEIDDATLPPGPDTASPLLLCNFRQGAAAFLAALPQPAPIGSLADVVAINGQDPANRAPYGQNLLAAAAREPMTAQEYARIHAVAQALAHQWMDTVLETNNVDVLVSGMAYTGSAGAAGVPALTVPAGLDPLGRPQGIILTGDYLSDPQLLALGFALEQQVQGRVEADLDAAIRQIDAVRAGSGREHFNLTLNDKV